MAKKRDINVNNLLATSHLLIGQPAPKTSSRSYHQERKRVETQLQDGTLFPPDQPREEEEADFFKYRRGRF